MKNKWLFIALCAFIVSCASPRYLPSSEHIDINQYGSNIKIRMIKGSPITGELIAIDSNKITVLVEKINQCKVVSTKEMRNYNLRFASPKNYFWSIPASAAITISHGFWLLLTMPANLIATTIISVSSEDAFEYSSKEIKLEDLSMFARFPQGVPANLSLDDLTNENNVSSGKQLKTKKKLKK